MREQVYGIESLLEILDKPHVRAPSLLEAKEADRLGANQILQSAE